MSGRQADDRTLIISFVIPKPVCYQQLRRGCEPCSIGLHGQQRLGELCGRGVEAATIVGMVTA